MAIAASVLEAMLIKAGCSAEQIVAVVKADEEANAERIARKREQNRLRQQKHRERNAMSRVTERDAPLSPPSSDKERSPTPPKEINSTPLTGAVSLQAKLAVFDGERCELGIEGLKQFRREWDDELKVFRDNPVKDWCEHIASSFRYLGLAWKEAIPKDTPPPKPQELEYVVGPTGLIQGNMSVKEAVEAMVRRRRGRE